MKLHERIRRYRIDHGITQTFVANKIGKDSKWLSAKELGTVKLTADEFEMICVNGFGVNPSIFFKIRVLDSKNNSSSDPNPAA